MAVIQMLEEELAAQKESMQRSMDRDARGATAAVTLRDPQKKCVVALRRCCMLVSAPHAALLERTDLSVSWVAWRVPS